MSGRQRARVLVADDNADMRAYLARLLSTRWRVEVVGDGQAALASARNHPPDMSSSPRPAEIWDSTGWFSTNRFLGGRMSEEA
jgi:hypothetical protein